MNCSPWTLRPNFPLIRTWINRSKDHPLAFRFSAENMIPMLLAFPSMARHGNQVSTNSRFFILPIFRQAPVLVRLHIEVGGGRIPPFTEPRITSWPAFSTHYFILASPWNSWPLFRQHQLGTVNEFAFQVQAFRRKLPLCYCFAFVILR